MRSNVPLPAAIASAGWVALCGLGFAGGNPNWLPTAGPASQAPFDGVVRAATSFDDGQGPALYVGGSFANVGLTPVQAIARLDDDTWSSVGSGLAGSVYALAAFDDGSGPALYAGGVRLGTTFGNTTNVMRWNGTAWVRVGAPFGGTAVNALAVFDDGTGDALYAGGSFNSADGLPTLNVARWDGTSWSALGIGPNNAVHAFAVFDDGTGAALYAGGTFNAAGGVVAPRVAKWDGTSWTSLATGVNGAVLALAVFDDGTGPKLCAGGEFDVAGGVSAIRIARWNGTAWSRLGAGFPGTSGPFNKVFALAAFDDGSGVELYAGGELPSSPSPSAGIMRWRGNWRSLPGRPGGYDEPVHAFAKFDDGTGVGLYAAGEWGNRGLVARWRNGDWTTSSRGLDGYVNDVVAYDDGTGPGLCAVGGFRFAGGARVNHVARWDGTTWSSLGGGLGGGLGTAHVGEAEVFQGELYVAGNFQLFGRSISRWNGNAWSRVGAGDLAGSVSALTKFDDGGGVALYVGGTFATADGVPVNNIAKWDGTRWSAVSGGVDNPVWELAVYDDGGGPALYVAGTFQNAGGAPALRIARWDGNGWSPLGGGLDQSPSVLAVCDTGSGPGLYANAGASSAGITDRLVSWNGTAWSGTGFGWTRYITALSAFDDGSGEALFVGTQFEYTHHFYTYSLQRYDGTSWSGVDDVLNGYVLALASLPGAAFGPPALFVGGAFSDAGDTGDAFLTRWSRTAAPPASFCSGDGSGVPCPCGNPGAPGHGCDLPAATGGIQLTVGSWLPDFAGGGRADFVAQGLPASTQDATHLIRSPSAQAPATVFGDGLLCVATTGLVRIGATPSSGGTALNSVMHGAGAGTFYYQLWARSQPVSFCDPLAAWNMSNGVELTWP